MDNENLKCNVKNSNTTLYKWKIMFFHEKCQGSEESVRSSFLHELLHQNSMENIRSMEGTCCGYTLDGTPGCFDSNLQVIFIVDPGVSQTAFHVTPQIICWGFRSGYLGL